MKKLILLLLVLMLLVGGCATHSSLPTNYDIMDELTNVEAQISLNHDILINRLAVCEAEMDVWKFDASNERSLALYWQDQATDMHNRFICAYYDIDYGCLECVLHRDYADVDTDKETAEVYWECIEQTLPEYLWPSW